MRNEFLRPEIFSCGNFSRSVLLLPSIISSLFKRPFIEYSAQQILTSKSAGQMSSTFSRFFGLARSMLYQSSSQISPFLSAQAAVTRHISTTPACLAEPLKKRKRIDPAVVKAREERKKKKLEKQIRQMQKHALKLKPVDEVVYTKKFQQEIPSRARKLAPIPEEEQERRILLQKAWTRYKYYQHLAEQDKITTMISSQETALRELRLESEELYSKAVTVDEKQLPFSLKAPVFTPPIPGYDAPDGDYVDTTRKW